MLEAKHVSPEEVTWAMRGAQIQAAETARRLKQSGADREDLECAARLGVLLALRRFDPGRGVRFTTYAWWCVRGSLTQAVRQGRQVPDRYGEALGREGGPEPWEEPPLSLDGWPAEWWEEKSLEGLWNGWAPEPEEIAVRNDFCGRVQAAVERLPEPLLLVVRLKHLEGLGLTETARRLGITWQAVSLREKRAFLALRQMLAESGDEG